MNGGEGEADRLSRRRSWMGLGMKWRWDKVNGWRTRLYGAGDHRSPFSTLGEAFVRCSDDRERPSIVLSTFSARHSPFAYVSPSDNLVCDDVLEFRRCRDPRDRWQPRLHLVRIKGALQCRLIFIWNSCTPCFPPPMGFSTTYRGRL